MRQGHAGAAAVLQRSAVPHSRPSPAVQPKGRPKPQRAESQERPPPPTQPKPKPKPRRQEQEQEQARDTSSDEGGGGPTRAGRGNDALYGRGGGDHGDGKDGAQESPRAAAPHGTAATTTAGASDGRRVSTAREYSNYTTSTTTAVLSLGLVYSSPRAC